MVAHQVIAAPQVTAALLPRPRLHLPRHPHPRLQIQAAVDLVVADQEAVLQEMMDRLSFKTTTTACPCAGRVV